ncbi:SMP-30/gluconolactonase/LRE family protein [Xylophilus sp. GOD-11R]|uniref:SMP-30/gluconolactonase/LRE family protein n=1 Tax=Xylophilus sp. GOD-11R TaxID=3089814 RepID=UPI00298CE13B|nr:SMP-30/gluconolactonase/LRE family protein [Xylophilus sp. GOD-11R]WPB56522.1 SMP-30/gluconolactonase/LRE family protein [Xylophilus sp. GOD-11R]
MGSTAELIVDARNGTGESPVWRADEQALYWVDIPGRALHRWSPADGHRTWRTDQMPACVAATATPGRWIAGMETGVFELMLGEHAPAIARPLARVNHARPDMRFNDGRCDRQGRFWAGTMCLDMAAAVPAGACYRFDGDDTALPSRLAGFIVPNGLAFSPDGRTMYLSDSHPQVQSVWAFDYDTASGTPSGRRLFVDMRDLPGRPDGAAIDVDGCYWICGNDAGLVHRFTPDGRLDRSLAVPVKKPAMCAFGGAGLDTLFVTSIRPDGDLSDQPLAGGVFALRPGVQGLPEPVFNG